MSAPGTGCDFWVLLDTSVLDSGPKRVTFSRRDDYDFGSWFSVESEHRDLSGNYSAWLRVKDAGVNRLIYYLEKTHGEARVYVQDIPLIAMASVAADEPVILSFRPNAVEPKPVLVRVAA